MKKSILISLCMVMAVTAVLTSCKKDNDVVSFRATISNYRNTDNNGKVYIDANRYANWIDQDEVLINGTTYTVGVTGTGDNRIASINGVTAVTSGGYYAIYPAECALPTPTTGTIPTTGFPQILLPQVQVYRNDNPDNPAQGNQIVDAPMAAYCAANNTQVGLDFTNLCSLLKITLPSAMEVGYITVSSTSTPLWGRATITGTDSPTLSTPSLTDLYTTDNTVTLDCTTPGLHHDASGASQGVNSAGPFYIVLPPATNVQGLTINVYVFTGNASGQSRRTILKYAKTTSNPIAIASNNIYVTGNLPTQGVEVPDVPFPNLGSGEFSVSSTKKVRFALGNLQYQASTNPWRFATNQWTAIKNASGNTTTSNRNTQAYWIDLFGYGTSGNNNHYPWQTSTTQNQSTNYATGIINNTTNDWGVNAIVNGGNQPNKWRTLTSAELYYLFNTRGGSLGWLGGTVAEKLHHTGMTVHGVSGMIVLPDDFPWNTAPYNDEDYWDNITDTKWTDLENQGAVFFPVTGRRSGTSVSSSTTTGYYWTSSCNTSYNELTPYDLYFTSSGETSDHSDKNYYGNAVRLARDVN